MACDSLTQQTFTWVAVVFSDDLNSRGSGWGLCWTPVLPSMVTILSGEKARNRNQSCDALCLLVFRWIPPLAGSPTSHRRCDFGNWWCCCGNVNRSTELAGALTWNQVVGPALYSKLSNVGTAGRNMLGLLVSVLFLKYPGTKSHEANSRMWSLFTYIRG